MRQKWLYWNNASRKWLWLIVIIGLVASIPVIRDRVQTESSANKVELVFNYRGLLDISAYQAHPQDYLDQQMTRLKDAGVTTMAVFESTLDELKKTRRLMVYSGQDLANMTKEVIPSNANYTYVLFTSEENAQTYTPIIEQTFAERQIPVQPWEYEGRSGLILQTPPENANMQPMQPDPVAVKMLRDKGFHILPRISDTVPYNQQSMERLLTFFEENGVTRILFDGDAVKGYNDNADMKSLDQFAQLLNKHHIGLAAIENLKKPQSGFETLAYKIDYNVTRLYSLSDGDANLKEDTIADRFVLATKDRNIRMLYMNASPSRNTAKAEITDPIDNLIKSLGEPGHAVERMAKHGFELGQAEAFTVKDSSIQRYAKLIALIGAIALITLMVSYFAPIFTIAVFLLGLVGSAGLFLLKPTLLEQGIALLVAIAAPTIAMVLAVRTVNATQLRQPDAPAGRRLAQTIVLYVRTSIISFTAVPFVIALLNSITYSLVINQFRGVSLLHFAPIGLVAIYIVFYRGSGSISVKQVKDMLRMPINILMVVLALVAAVVGYYYLSRTGNAGSVTPFEMFLRTTLEDTFGVRPRFKEFVLGHPLFIVGVFAALKYRKVIFALIIATMGQLSMVDTFAHIHTPAVLSLIRGVMGLGLGLIFGIIAVGVWQVAEGCWKKWSPLLKKLVISGYYGFRNSGDEAVLKSILTALQEESQRSNVTIEPIVLSIDPEWTTSMYGVRAVHRMKLKEVREALKESDGLISGGGSLLQDATGLKSIPYYLGVIKLAQWLKKPTFIYAQGIGPVHRKIFNPMIKSVFKSCTYVSVRDEQSADYLRRLGLKWNQIHVVPDPVMGLPLPDSASSVRDERDTFIAGEQPAHAKLPVIGVSVRFWESDRKELTAIATGLKKLAAKKAVHLRFMPFHLPDDVQASRFVMELIGDVASKGSEISITEDLTDPQHMLEEVSRCDLMIGMRLHSLIYAASQYVPPVGISYDPKIDQFLLRLESEPAGNTSSMDGDKLAEMVAALLDQRSQWLKQHEDRITALKQEAIEPAKQIITYLGRKG